jgi:hypothetical protein
MYFDYTADNKEITGHQVRNFEQWAGGLLAWQLNSNFSLETQADVYYEIFQATSETDPKYRIPKSPPTLDLYGKAKYVLKGFSAVAAVDQGIRFGWTDFGCVDAPPPTSSTYQKYSLQVSQHAFVGKLTVNQLLRRPQPRSALPVLPVIPGTTDDEGDPCGGGLVRFRDHAHRVLRVQRTGPRKAGRIVWALVDQESFRRIERPSV